MPLEKRSPGSEVGKREVSLLHLPELALDCILEQLSPAGLSIMEGVCRSLRDRCRSDHLWKKHMEHKWGRLIGDAAYREWQCHVSLKKRPVLSDKDSLSLEASKNEGSSAILTIYEGMIHDYLNRFHPHGRSRLPNPLHLMTEDLKARFSNLIKPKLESHGNQGSPLPTDSIKAFYLSLESGNFWFRARVYSPHVPTANMPL